MINKTLLHYMISEKLGQGGMGVVYKAQDSKLNRTVAIKFLPDFVLAEESDRFKIEAQAAARLNHPNIATVYAIEETADVTFIVMEYIEGLELRHVIKNGDLSVDDIVKITIQLADGLQTAHEHDIIHRDIKSSNIMLNSKGAVKIMDFGLAKMMGHSQVTRAGTTLGTIAYMSPEQSRGETVDVRSDIWAAGVVLYEMLTGNLPFRGDYEAAVLYAILNEDPPPIGDSRHEAPDALVNIVLKALQKSPKDRYSSMAELLEDLYKLQPQSQIAVKKDKSVLSSPPNNKERRASSHHSSSMTERRQITALYCRLVPNSPLDEVDPEELHDALPIFYQNAEKVIQRFDGHIAPSIGEGLLVFFGYPKAHEDDAYRAAMAGLAIIDGIKQQNRERAIRGEIELAVLAGMHTGMVVFGMKGHSGSQSVVGDTPELGTHLASMAMPNTLLSSKASIPLLEKLVDYEPLGEQTILGAVHPIELFQIKQSSARARFAGAEEQVLPLIGRRRELDTLTEHWDLTIEDREGRVVCLSADAGLGKSHLVRSLKSHIRQTPNAWLTEISCSTHYKNSALYPIIDFFERVGIGFEPGEDVVVRLQKIEGFLVQYGFELNETVPLFADLMSVPLNDKYEPLQLTPERQKQKTLDLLLGFLLRRAEQQPVLFVVEDLHWADPTTLELLTLLVDMGPTSKVYSLFTYRPEFTPAWQVRSHVDVLNLMKLKRKDIIEIVEAITKGRTMPDEIIDQIIAKTDGVPLFVEELSKSVLESKILTEQDGKLVLANRKRQISIPATLRDSLTARLDRLGTAKEVAQLGAVIGRQFSSELLQAISIWDEKLLNAELEKLVDAELLYKNVSTGSLEYVFKHALIQDAAYDSILKKNRHQLHADIAKAILEKQPDVQENKPELLAHHYTEAGNIEQAIPMWLKAGQLAYMRSANKEAIVDYSKGLELLNRLPQTPESMQQELALNMHLGLSYIATLGYTNPEVEISFSRAREICEQFGEVPQLFPVLWGLWAFYIVRRDFDMAFQLGDEMLRLAEQTNDADLLLEAHTAHGLNFLYSRGDFKTSRSHFETAYSYYSPENHKAHVAVYVQDAGIVSLAHLSWLQWLLGEVDEALETKNKAVVLAEELGHPYSLSYALTWAAVLHQFRLEPQAAVRYADRVLALAMENIFPNWIADGDMVRGWAVAGLGETDAGIEQLKRGLATWHAIGARLWQTHATGLLVDVLLQSDQIEEGLTTVNEALKTVEETNETYYEAELWRLKGELLLKQEPADRKMAESCFIKARQIAEKQNAVLFELRAIVSLVRLGQKQGQAEIARTEIQNVLHRIVRGETTGDIQTAQNLLNDFEEKTVA